MIFELPAKIAMAPFCKNSPSFSPMHKGPLKFNTHTQSQTDRQYQKRNAHIECAIFLLYAIVDFNEWTSWHAHIVRTCGTVALKKTREILFGVEFHGECYFFPGLTTEQLQSLTVVNNGSCYAGIGGDHYISMYQWILD